MAGLASIATFGLRFVAQDQASAVLGDLANKYKFFNKVTGRGFEEVAAKIKEGGLAQKLAMGTAGLVGYQLVQGVVRASALATGALRSIVKEAADFQQEMAMFGVIVGKSGDQLTGLKEKILEVTGPLPTTAIQVARAASAFAKMGLAADTSAENLIDLSNQAIMFGRAIGVSDEQAAMFMGKLATWLKLNDLTADSMGRVASVVTRMGFRIKGTSVDIIKATERFGAFVRAMGATEVETLSLAALVQDSGILIRRGSTAINRTFQLMATNTRSFGQTLARMGEVGSAVDFEKMFRTKPVKAFETLLRALSKRGGAYNAVMLKSLGLHGNYISDLITMSRNVGKLGQLQKEGEDEEKKYAQGLGMTQKAFDEYRKTMNAAIKTLEGAWDVIKVTMGGPLLGTLSTMFQWLANVLTFIVSEPILRGLVKLIGILVLIAAVTLVIVKVYTLWKLAMAAVKAAGLVSAAANIKGFLIFLAVAVAIVAVFTLLLWIFRKLTGSSKGLKDSLKDVTSGIKDVSGQVVSAASGGMIEPTGEVAGIKESGEMSTTPAAMAGISEINVPGAAKGGVFNRPTPVVIGEAGPEVAMPVAQLTGMMERFVAAIERRNESEPMQTQVQSSLYLDGQVVARSVAETEELENLRSGRLG
jgi:TP901 family phage tail tape measure protein